MHIPGPSAGRTTERTEHGTELEKPTNQSQTSFVFFFSRRCWREHFRAPFPSLVFVQFFFLNEISIQFGNICFICGSAAMYLSVFLPCFSSVCGIPEKRCQNVYKAPKVAQCVTSMQMSVGKSAGISQLRPRLHPELMLWPCITIAN